MERNEAVFQRGTPELAKASARLTFLVLATLAAALACPLPASAGDVTAGTNPYSVAVGDFNGDRKPDLVTANYQSNDVSVLISNGDGTFQAARNFSTGLGTNPIWVATGDFNGDGNLDVVVVNSSAESVGVLLGDGAGGLGPVQTFAVASSSICPCLPQAVAVGDFNGDGKLDLAVANFDSKNVTVLFGNGNGTFQAAQVVATFSAGYPIGIAVGDLNGDGIADIAVANPDPQSPNIAVLISNGNGTFQAAQIYPYPAFGDPESIAIDDYNGDGKPDLAAASDDSPTGHIAVLLNKGDGTFGTAQVYVAGGSNSESVAAGDFNGDGRPDLAVANYGSNDVGVLLGNGNGTFQAPLSFAVGPQPQFVAVGDFDGDGKPDLAIANGGGGTVTVLLGNGDGTFSPGARATLTVTKAGTGSGTVKSSETPPQIDCESTCATATASYNAGAVVTLTAVADPSSTFARWDGCDTVSDSTCTVTMSASRAVTATFTPKSVVLTATKAGSGSGAVVSSETPPKIDCESGCGAASASYDSGTPVTLTATADSGSTFAGWGGCDRTSVNTCTVTMNATRSVTATFTLQRFALTVTKGGTGSGTVISSETPPQIDCESSCSAASASYDSGAVVTLTAAADPGSTFVRWSGCDSASGVTCTVTMSAAKSVTATFNHQRFTLTVNKSGVGGTVTSSDGSIRCGPSCSSASASYDSGTGVVLNADPGLGVFTGWSGCDSTAGTTCGVTMNAVRSVTASFIALPLF